MRQPIRQREDLLKLFVEHCGVGICGIAGLVVFLEAGSYDNAGALWEFTGISGMTVQLSASNAT